MFDQIRILHDGGSMVAVEKPAGILTQAPPGVDSLEHRLRQQFASRTDYIAMVHRLDREVSGVLLVALSKRVARLLSDQFAAQKVQKNYLAVVSGVSGVSGQLHPSQAIWLDYLCKLPGQARAKVCSQTDSDAKLAETKVEVLSVSQNQEYSLLRLMPVTGRMHQLRVQSAHRGSPILGDTLYGGRELGAKEGATNRILLHAESIMFHHPRSGVRMSVQCPVEGHFELLHPTFNL